MSREVKLYHVSHAEEKESLEKYGLSPECVQSCIGGQMEGIYFFSTKNWAKEWMWRNRYTQGGEGYICTARIPEKDITFPNWRLDLFFNQGIIDDLTASLKRYYKPKADKNGFVALDLESQYAISGSYGDGDFFFERRLAHIAGLRFKNGHCIALYTEEGMTGTGAERISSAMDEDFYGFADTLLEHMCQRDPKLLKQYNQKLRQNMLGYFKQGAVKYVGCESIPVTAERYDISEDPLYYICGFLMLSQIVALANEFTECPAHKRIPEAIRQIQEHFEDDEKHRKKANIQTQMLAECRKNRIR